MNNPHIISASPRTAFGLHFTKEHNNISNSYEEIDERLFDTYLEIPGRKNNTSFESNNNNNNSSKSLSSADVSSAEEDESDSSSHKISSVIGTGRKSIKNTNTRKTKSYKKEELFDSDNDSLHEFTKPSKKSSKSNKKLSTAASVTSQESSETEKKQKSLYKTELCRNWEETGHCRYGMKCQYAHGAADLREIDRHPKYKTQKCRTFHQTGSCPYGARCTFRHFNLPGDALEMKNLDKEEEEEKRQQQQQQQQQQEEQHREKVILNSKKVERPSVFSVDNQKVLQQNWFLDNNASPLAGLGDASIPKRNMMMNHLANTFDPEDSLLPSNAESLLPHQLLFDLESPDEDEEPARCPLRNYVNLPSFSSFPHNHHQLNMNQQQQQQQQCKTFFRPWLF